MKHLPGSMRCESPTAQANRGNSALLMVARIAVCVTMLALIGRTPGAFSKPTVLKPWRIQ
jgi:hypothetical protein